MNINDKSVLEMLNKLIAIDRLNKAQILQMVNLVSLSIDINDKPVLEMLNKLIAIDRLNKIQILQMVNLVSLSNDINDLKDNLKWENSKSFN